MILLTVNVFINSKLLLLMVNHSINGINHSIIVINGKFLLSVNNSINGK